LNLGHERIAFIGIRDEEGGTLALILRHRGVERAVDERGALQQDDHGQRRAERCGKQGPHGGPATLGREQEDEQTDRPL